jgi:hypothetical protein
MGDLFVFTRETPELTDCVAMQDLWAKTGMFPPYFLLNLP